jgi:hypothetical protein
MGYERIITFLIRWPNSLCHYNRAQFGKDDFEETHLSDSFTLSQIKTAIENATRG